MGQTLLKRVILLYYILRLRLRRSFRKTYYTAAVTSCATDGRLKFYTCMSSINVVLMTSSAVVIPCSILETPLSNSPP